MRIRSAMLPAALAILGLVASRPAPGATRPRLLLLVENRSSSVEAAPEIARLLQSALDKKGYDVVLAPEAPGESIADLTKRLHADASIDVTIGFYLSAKPRVRGPQANSAVGFSAKFFQGGGERPAWHNSLGLVAEDEVRPADQDALKADQDALKTLSTTACRRLLWTLPVPEGAVVVADEEEAQAGQIAQPVPSYQVPLERLRALREGPRFQLRVGRQRPSPPRP